jgi:molybdenum cofactor biosynthesis enzyme MoaA|tara:strand:+ start:2487 stop:2744 length:258 start_codon:yes stop_codon:yes gene_type:complete
LKYLLVNKFDEIIDKVDLSDDVGISGAKTYFVKRKQIDESEFDKLWKVQTENDFDLGLRSSLQNRQVEWWKEDKDIVDDEDRLLG